MLQRQDKKQLLYDVPVKKVPEDKNIPRHLLNMLLS